MNVVWHFMSSSCDFSILQYKRKFHYINNKSSVMHCWTLLVDQLIKLMKLMFEKCYLREFILSISANYIM